MAKLAKRHRENIEKIEKSKLYPLQEALSVLKSLKAPKFDESVEVALQLGVDPRKPDQMVRGTCSFPNGLGKEIRVLVFAKGEKATEAEEAGADYVGSEDFMKKIQEGWFEFERVVATPDMMNIVGRLGKILGPRGLMPNPKVGTVTMNVGAVVKEIKAGQVEFRVDKAGIVHAPVGKASFEVDQLQENIKSFVEVISRMKPSTAKGIYMRTCSISSTMGPGIKIDLQNL